MRHLVVLGGNSPKNAKWTALLGSALKPYSAVYVQSYRHWADTSVPEIEFDSELSRLVDNIKDQKGYAVVAKSAGALLALQGISQGRLKPAALVVIGLPLSYAMQRNIPLQKLVDANQIPTLYIQAQDDPVGNSAATKAVMGEKGSLAIIPGDDHDYRDIEKLAGLVTEFLARH